MKFVNKIKNMRLIWVVIPLILIGGISIQNSEAQSLSPGGCFSRYNDDFMYWSYLSISNEFFSDWELLDIETGCNAVIATYEISEFSTRDTTYKIEQYVEFGYIENQREKVNELLKNQTSVISNHILKLHETKLFKEINEKTFVKTVSFRDEPLSPIWYEVNNLTHKDSMSFHIESENQYGFTNTVKINPSNGIKDRPYLELTNDVDIESYGVNESRKQADIFFRNMHSTCQIMSCSESSCGMTVVDARYNDYSAEIQIEGESCPPQVRVSLNNELKLNRIYPLDEGGYGKYDWKLLQETKFNPPLKQIKDNIKPENILCNHGLYIVFKPSNGDPYCVTSKTMGKLIDRDWVPTIGKLEID